MAVGNPQPHLTEIWGLGCCWGFTVLVLQVLRAFPLLVMCTELLDIKHRWSAHTIVATM
jgi:hypothetical protein